MHIPTHASHEGALLCRPRVLCVHRARIPVPCVYLHARTHARHNIVCAESAVDENIYGAGFWTIIGFPLDRILFHSSVAYPDYRSPCYHRYVFTLAYWNLLSTICRRSRQGVLRAIGNDARPATMGASCSWYVSLSKKKEQYISLIVTCRIPFYGNRRIRVSRNLFYINEYFISGAI